MYLGLYRLCLWGYRIKMHLLSPWNKKAGYWLEGRKNLMARLKLSIPSSGEDLIWMHCASRGEFEQGLPLLEKMRNRYPSYKILVTFFYSPGYELKYENIAADYIFYLPVDSKKNAVEFLEIANPKLVFWIKNNFWFYYLRELKKRRIPVLLISGVFNEERGYFAFSGRIQKHMLNLFSHLFVQTEGSAAWLRSAGISRGITVAGDTRFDRVIEIASQFNPIPLIEAFCGKNLPVIVAGNTWEEDEEQLDHYANAHPEIRFIIAPHSLDEEGLANIKKLFRRSVYYSTLVSNSRPEQDGKKPVAVPGALPDLPNVLIMDHIGILAQLYKYATIAYVGGGFVDEGVHNVLEAAVYGKPVLFGPVIEEAIEAMDLVDNGGGMVIDSALEAEEVFNRLLTHPDEYFASGRAAKEYVWRNQGATRRIMDYIQENLLLTSW